MSKVSIRSFDLSIVSNDVFMLFCVTISWWCLESYLAHVLRPKGVSSVHEGIKFCNLMTLFVTRFLQQDVKINGIY